MKFRTVAALCAALAVQPALAYGPFSAIAPFPPYSRDQYSFEQYRGEVEDYVRRARQFVEDGNEELDRIELEMRTIQEEQEQAIRKANQVVEEFNSWAQGSE